MLLKKYERESIQNCIEIVNAFTDTDIKNKMDKISKGFFDRWTSLRTLRNSIIHSNNCYISKVKVSSLKKLIDESIKIFSYLKSEVIINSYSNASED